jgi:hypothetical protein
MARNNKKTHKSSTGKEDISIKPYNVFQDGAVAMLTA